MVYRAPRLRTNPVSPTIPAIDDVVADAIQRRVFPGAVVGVVEAGVVRHFAAYGSTMYDQPGTRTVCQETIYDVASLTKMFTATAALRQYEAGALDLSAPASHYVPELRARGVLVRHLLTHTSGLDVRLSVLAPEGPERILQAAYQAEQKHAPGTHVAYTNINSLLLGAIVARLHRNALDAAIVDLVIGPLGLAQTCFNPPAELRDRIAPTEQDDAWRAQLVHASVHDESAHALGGVAGHAGLFSTAGDLLRFCEAWLSPSLLLRRETIGAATSNQTAGLGLGCGLGWMIDRPNFMGAAPAGTFGHTGFTGPAIVLVPGRQMAVVVLSNRVFPRRGAPAHHPVTADIVRAAL